jgi:hypothetical protein
MDPKAIRETCLMLSNLVDGSSALILGWMDCDKPKDNDVTRSVAGFKDAKKHIDIILKAIDKARDIDK